jgi:hypothetical protein
MSSLVSLSRNVLLVWELKVYHSAHKTHFVLRGTI